MISEDQSVLTLTVYKMEPECLNYSARAKSEYETHQPEYLEQLQVLKGLLNALLEKSTEDNLNKWIGTNRTIREEIYEERLKKEAKGADSGPEGGQPEFD